MDTASGQSNLLFMQSTITYPVPTISSISPSPANAGQGFTLTVNGTGFGPGLVNQPGTGSVVEWNFATPLTTTYVSPTELQANVPAALDENGPDFVGVFNPTPGGGTSNGVILTINDVAPIAEFSDYAALVNQQINVGLLNPYDPAEDDTAAGFHYSYATTLAGLATSYSGSTNVQFETLSYATAGVYTIYARIIDVHGTYTTYSAHIVVQNSNAAPVLNGANDLGEISANDVDNPGVLVSSLVAGEITDSNPNALRGIAVIGLTATNGVWQYSTNGGTTWTTFGPVSNTSATLLEAASQDYVRFQPNAQNGGGTETITFRAWDLTDRNPSGQTGVDVSTNGGSTAYSTATATSSILVLGINTPPVTAPADYTTAENAPLTMSIAGILANDAPASPVESGETLTVSSFDATTTEGGTVVLSGTNLIYTPPQDYFGPDSFTYVALNNGTTYGFPDPREATGVVNISVTAVNQPPIAVDQDLTSVLPTVTEGTSGVNIPVSDLLANDSPGPANESGQSLTVIGVANPVGGSVTLSGNQVQFTPAANFYGIASFQYTIQDNGTTDGVPDPKTATATASFIVVPTNPVVANFPNSIGASWGDFDGDGELDLLSIVNNGTGGPSTLVVYRNGGTSFSTVDTSAIPQLFGMQALWGDFNRDGTLEILVSGWNVHGASVVQIYEFSSTANKFVLETSIPTALGDPSATWEDIDDNGELDVVISGTNSGPVTGYSTEIWLNNGTPTPSFTLSATIANVAVLAWANIYNSGSIDFVGNTFNGMTASGTAVFANNLQGAFYLSTQITSSGESPFAAFGDYDNDGYADLMLGSGIYHNNGGYFTPAYSLGGAEYGTWLDYNNNGSVEAVYSHGGAPDFLQYNGSQFVVVPTPSELSFASGPISAADVYNQGVLDLLIGSNLYANYTTEPNTPPAAPTGLTAVVNSPTTALLSWTAPTDAQTPSAGLSYSIVLGTTPGAGNVVAAPALASGLRTLVEAGTIDGTSWVIIGLTHGQTYYWSVQAVDSTFAGSPFSAEGSFVVDQAPFSHPSSDTVFANTPLVLGSSDFPFNDPDPGDTLQAIQITSLPTIGSLTLDGNPVTEGESIQATDIVAGNLVFQAPNTPGPAPQSLIGFEVSDGYEWSAAQTLTINIIPTATAPTLTLSNASGTLGFPISLAPRPSTPLSHPATTRIP